MKNSYVVDTELSYIFSVNNGQLWIMGAHKKWEPFIIWDPVLIEVDAASISQLRYNEASIHHLRCTVNGNTGLILGLRPANERRRYFVTTSLIGWGKPRISPESFSIHHHLSLSHQRWNKMVGTLQTAFSALFLEWKFSYLHWNFSLFLGVQLTISYHRFR